MLLNAIRIILALLIIVAALGAVPTRATEHAADIPAWLQRHVGTGDGQIAPVVLQRARALYKRKVQQGVVWNPCYLAKDATRPSSASNGEPGSRFYVICESKQLFRAVSSGYGNGRKLPRANFSNGRECAKNFSNAEGSKLTMGGAYLTAETRTSFKGYYMQSGKRKQFHRTFLLYDGEGDTANSRERAIGGHPAVFLKWQCRLKRPASPYADKDGYVPFGRLVNYTGGRSNGCTTWSPAASTKILSLVEGNPTTLYIYPEARDINAVAKALKGRKSLLQAGLYWNASCLRKIGSPKFWHKRNLQPIINKWRRSLPKQPPLALPICR